MSGFSFAFSGDDIEETVISETKTQNFEATKQAAETGTLRRPTNSAFPIAGQAQLAPTHHDLNTLLESLPSKIAYSTLVVTLDDGENISIPRRELWDVRIQLMAEEDDEGLSNLGKDDVRTGVYEGGFKSWESSVDIVKILHGRKEDILEHPGRIIELGCGTALPSLAVFQWLLKSPKRPQAGKLRLALADYNPTVLQLVTLPNLLLSWAQVTGESSWESEGELDVDVDLLEKFVYALTSHGIDISFLSGAWSPEFVQLAIKTLGPDSDRLTVLGAETIYSPAALRSFAETLMALLGTGDVAFIAAKKVYFGVGGSMEDFCDAIRAKGADIKQIREESDGVRRAVVEIRST